VSIDSSPKLATPSAPQQVKTIKSQWFHLTAIAPASKQTVEDASTTAQIHHLTMCDVAQAAVAMRRINIQRPPAAANSLEKNSIER
jgi:hypothetical protein